MDQSKFEQGEAILHPPTPSKYVGNISAVASPATVQYTGNLNIYN